MPITRKRIAPFVFLLALLLLATQALAGGKFTLVIGGKITAVEALDAKLVHARAVGEMAKAGGFGLSLDAGTGIVSLTRGGGDVEEGWKGFKSGVTFVVDGKIVKVVSKASAGAPYVSSNDLKKLAQLMGFEADLDGTVLALTPDASGGSTTVATNSGGGANGHKGVPGLPSGDAIGGDIARLMSGGLGGTPATATAPAHDGSVCGYMDSQRVLWSATEPNVFEKETFQRMADLWSKKDKSKGNMADLELFERTLKGFHAKAQQRLKGTLESKPPAAAIPWYDASVNFLKKVDDILKLCFDMIRVMKLPEDKQKAEFEQLKKNIERIKKMDTEQKALGTTQVDETYRVREANGCSPP